MRKSRGGDRRSLAAGLVASACVHAALLGVLSPKPNQGKSALGQSVSSPIEPVPFARPVKLVRIAPRPEERIRVEIESSPELAPPSQESAPPPAPSAEALLASMGQVAKVAPMVSMTAQFAAFRPARPNGEIALPEPDEEEGASEDGRGFWRRLGDRLSGKGGAHCPIPPVRR